MPQNKYLVANARLLVFALVAACGGDGPGTGTPDPNNPQTPEETPTEQTPGELNPLPEPPPPSEWEVRLAARRVDYPRALRSAALRLIGEYPTLDETLAVSTADAAANKTAYEATIDKYIADPRFTTQVLGFWRDAFRLGGSAATDQAAVLAAMLTVQDGNWTEVLTRQTGGCPTFADGTFTAADCPATTVPGGHSGVLTNAQVVKAYYGPMMFRHVKWIQETFVCTRFPAEIAPAAKDLGDGGQPYTSPWPEKTVTGGSAARIDFLAGAPRCENCHGTSNRQAPLFINFDSDGVWQAQPEARVPIPGNPRVTLADYMPTNEYAWRVGEPVTNIADLGARMVADPDVAECAVARAWNWAMGQYDVVDGLAAVPSGVIAGHVATFKSSNYKFKEVVRSVFKSDDYVRF